jgi:hypothetical protein
MVIPALIESAATASPIPIAKELLGMAVGEKLQEWQRKREETANNILLGELQNGHIDEKILLERHPDHIFAAFARYQKAVRDGLGMTNLRLMAKIIRADFAASAAQEFNSDRNVYLQSIVAELSLAEIRLLMDLYKETQITTNKSASFRLTEKVIPEKYPTKAHFDAALARLLRTSLVQPLNTAWGTTYQTSPLMDELVALVSMEEWQQAHEW